MTVKFEDIVDVFDFVSFGQMYDCQAFLNRETGKVYLHSGLWDDEEEELPEDVEGTLQKGKGLKVHSFNYDALRALKLLEQ